MLCKMDKRIEEITPSTKERGYVIDGKDIFELLFKYTKGILILYFRSY